MEFPCDPTQQNASTEELLEKLPSNAARDRVLAAAGIKFSPSDRDFAAKLDELPPYAKREIEQQCIVTSMRIYFYEIPGLQRIQSADTVSQLPKVDLNGSFGPEVSTVFSERDQTYVVCSVPPGGSQTQLTYATDQRQITVATFQPGTQLLSVRAATVDTADATRQALQRSLDLGDASQVSFHDSEFGKRFEDTAVIGYSTMVFENTNDADSTTELEARASETDAEGEIDIRDDQLVGDLLDRSDLTLTSASGQVGVRIPTRSNLTTGTRYPTVTVSFADGCMAFEEFVPEKVLVELDTVIRKCL